MTTRKTAQTLFLDALVEAGVARDEAIRRVNALIDKHPELNVIGRSFVGVLSDLVTPDVISNLVRNAADDLAQLVKTGKGKIKADPSSLA
jgi:hypothetical protein